MDTLYRRFCGDREIDVAFAGFYRAEKQLRPANAMAQLEAIKSDTNPQTQKEKIKQLKLQYLFPQIETDGVEFDDSMDDYLWEITGPLIQMQRSQLCFAWECIIYDLFYLKDLPSCEIEEDSDGPLILNPSDYEQHTRIFCEIAKIFFPTYGFCTYEEWEPGSNENAAEHLAEKIYRYGEDDRYHIDD